MAGNKIAVYARLEQRQGGEQQTQFFAGQEVWDGDGLLIGLELGA